MHHQPSSPAPGAALSLLTTGTAPGAPVYVALSTVGPGADPCPPLLGGACLGLQQPQLLRSGPADGGGRASWSVTIPPTAPPGSTAWLQGWTVTPAGTAFGTSVVEVGVAGP